MAKLLIEDIEESIQVPFLRGILTRSLQKSGLSFQRAHALATEVRDDLEAAGGDRNVTKLELHRFVYKKLKRDVGAETADRYLRPIGQTPPVEVVDLDGRLLPFSGELHRRDLECIGLNMAESLKISGKLRRHLFREKMTRVSSQYLARVTYELLADSPALGPAVAQRWLVWREFQRSGRPLVLMIGGTTGCGKSTIATTLADQLGIVRMQSTDLLREVMRTILSSEHFPALHASSYDAWRALPEDYNDRGEGVSEHNVAAGYNAQVELLDVASRAVIERALVERESLVIEGVHVHPDLTAQLHDEGAVIVPVMLAILKRRHLKQRLSGRATKAVRRRAARYLNHFDEIWQLQAHLLSEADRTNTPIISNQDREEAVREIMRSVLDMLSVQVPATPETAFMERPDSASNPVT